MAITHLSVSNFKSFDRLEVDLGNLNVLIGANASGKSNFIEILRFLKDIRERGLRDAISMHGGVEYLRNICLDASTEMRLKIELDYDKLHTRVGRQGYLSETGMDYEPTGATYECAIRIYNGGSAYEVTTDRMIYEIAMFADAVDGNDNAPQNLGKGRVVVTASKGLVERRLELPRELPREMGELLHWSLPNAPTMPGSVLLDQSKAIPPLEYTPFFLDPFLLQQMRAYDLDPKLPKRAVPMTGPSHLEADGANLPFVLREILRYPDERRKFLNLVSDLLPFVDDLQVENLGERYLSLNVQEKYREGKFLPPFCLSDGTMNLIALIVILFFENVSVVIIEEPERNLHPHLISRLVQMFQEASEHKQIFLTTHNPEMIRHLHLEDLCLLSRDRAGFSQISRPSEKEEVHIFLENDMGVDRLFVDNLLGV